MVLWSGPPRGSALRGSHQACTASTGPCTVNSTTSVDTAGSASTCGIPATLASIARRTAATSAPCTSGTRTTSRRLEWAWKLMMLSPNRRPLPTWMRTLSGVSMVVTNRPISCTMPVTPPASISSPTLKGRSTSRKTPAAKLPSSPAHAEPMAMPAAASSAANDVVSMPIIPSSPSPSRMVSELPKSDST